ncbi:uncharacterized protein LOC124197814 [Daphnia pulex]|uniref:uncharacterized protein LOC124197814 n=1 Tax=Daphnia pulex TaxID=6669 RepID=UPI001EDE6617|nr:uncharacterized protein LOC124197814 [Daphnia pulex]XP_046449321.1 uncharacterized protein LOC124197814 [Daphnia pulex]
MSLDLDDSTKEGRRNYDILKKTFVGEAAGEIEQGQRAICWVIYNRVLGHKTYWYEEKEGNGIAGVCLKKGQFECWNEGEKRRDLEESLKTDWGKKVMAQIDKWLRDVYFYQGGKPKNNPIGKCDHYNNLALRSTTEDRLNNLTLMSIESDLLNDIDFNDIISDFASRKSRSVPI